MNDHGAACEKEYDFVLVLAGLSDLNDAVMDALFEAGCDDSTPSLRFGRVYLTFTRSARSMLDAILSAIEDVRRADIGAEIHCVDECNLVNQADIARQIDRSRQLVCQYISGERGPGCFPPPTCHITEGRPLWRWCEVAFWLRQNNMITQDRMDDVLHVAVVNSVLESERLAKLGADSFAAVNRVIGAGA